MICGYNYYLLYFYDFLRSLEKKGKQYIFKACSMLTFLLFLVLFTFPCGSESSSAVISFAQYSCAPTYFLCADVSNILHFYEVYAQQYIAYIFYTMLYTYIILNCVKSIKRRNKKSEFVFFFFFVITQLPLLLLFVFFFPVDQNFCLVTGFLVFYKMNQLITNSLSFYLGIYFSSMY